MSVETEQEIMRLRDRSHDLGNNVQTLIATVGSLDGKLDAIHASLKEGQRETLVEVRETNGRVSKHDRQIARVQGMVAAAIAGLPFVIFALNQLH